MRVALVLCLVAACRIPDEHFTAPGAGSDAGGDATSDAPADAAAVPLTKAYLLDTGSAGGVTTSGLYVLAKAANGDLAAGAVSPQLLGAAPTFAVTATDGTHLYVVAGGTTPRIGRYAIASDGSLTLSDSKLVTVAASYGALDPSGHYLVLASPGAGLTTVTLGTMGQLVSTMDAVIVGEKAQNVAFARSGTCLLALTTSTFNMTTSYWLHSFTFDTGGHVDVNRVAAPANPTSLAFAPGSSTAYVAAGTSVQAYTVDSSCTIALKGTVVNATGVSGGFWRLAIDPAARYLFATGNSVTVFALAADGGISQVNSANLAQDTVNSTGGVAFDPALPDVIYLAGPSYHATGTSPPAGAIAASIASAGALTAGSSQFPCPNGDTPADILLAK